MSRPIFSSNNPGSFMAGQSIEHNPRESFRTLLIDHDLDVRMRLKEAILSVYHFISVVHVNSFKEASLILNRDEGFDMIFVSYRFTDAEVLDFVDRAKLSVGGVDSAYILVAENHCKSDTQLARCLSGGIDCLLLEPYSVEELVEVTVMGRNIHRSRRFEREIIACQFIVRDLAKYIDLWAVVRARGKEGVYTRDKIASIMKMINSFHPEAREAYFKRLFDVFTSQPYPETYAKRLSYHIPSLRVREKLEFALLETLDKEMDPVQERKEIIARLMKW